MNRYDELHALVREMDEGYARSKHARETAATRETRYEIPGGLGTVSVAGSGQVVAIELETSNLRYTTAQALGGQLRQAIEAAERQADAEAKEVMAELSRPGRARRPSGRRR